MTTCSFGEIVLVPCPFTDQSDVEKRPAVIKPLFATIEKGLVIKKLGSLGNKDLNRLKEVLQTILG